MIDALDAGDLATARTCHLRSLSVIRAIMKTSQGAIMAKAALQLIGVLDNRIMRLPLIEAGEADLSTLRTALQSADLR